VNKSLLVSFAAAPWESPRSYLRRLARANGCEHYVEPELSSLDSAMAFYPKLAELLMPEHRAASKHVSLAYTKTRHGKATLFSGQLLHSTGLRKAGRPFCAKCLAEGNEVVPLAWELKETKICVVHRCQLQDRCPGCAGRVTWTSKTFAQCACGFDLRDSPRRQCAAASWILAHLTERALYRDTHEITLWTEGTLEYAHRIEFDWLLPLSTIIKNILLPKWFIEYANRDIVAVDPQQVDDTVLELLDTDDFVYSVQYAIFLSSRSGATAIEANLLPCQPLSDLVTQYGEALCGIPIPLNTRRRLQGHRCCWRFEDLEIVRLSPLRCSPRFAAYAREPARSYC
jgi:hypothetical protein